MVAETGDVGWVTERIALFVCVPTSRARKDDSLAVKIVLFLGV